MSKFFSLLALGVGGIIVADILIHPAGTTAATKGITSFTRVGVNGLLGMPS